MEKPKLKRKRLTINVARRAARVDGCLQCALLFEFPITKRKILTIIVDIVTKGLGRVARRPVLAANRHHFRPTGGLLAHRRLPGSAILEMGGAAIGRSVLGWD